MDQEKLKELFSDEEFVKELLAMEEPEQVQNALEDKGISVTTDEIQKVGELLRKVNSGEISQETLEAAASGELSEEELEEVAGGSIIVGLVFLGFLGLSIGGAYAVKNADRW